MVEIFDTARGRKQRNFLEQVVTDCWRTRQRVHAKQQKRQTNCQTFKV
jgi:hypothetical protein